MKTYTIPIFLGVRAENPNEAIDKALGFMEYALDTGNDMSDYPYCDIGNIDEVIEQKEVTE